MRELPQRIVVKGARLTQHPWDPEPTRPYEDPSDKPDVRYAVSRRGLTLRYVHHESKDYDKDGDKGNWEQIDILQREWDRRQEEKNK